MKTTNKNLILKPRVTEKASMVNEHDVYTFNVPNSANKTEIKKAIFTLYKVKPVKVNVLAVPKKITNFRGRTNKDGGARKALVYLKKGDKIEIV